MSIFAGKESFKALGIEPVPKTLVHTLQDCAICAHPLDLHPHLETEQQKQPSGLHTAVQIMACGHILGKECLDAWLDVGHTCPICKRTIFEAQRSAITKQDVDDTMRVLCRYFSADAIEASMKRVLRQLNQEYLQRMREQGGEVEEMSDDGFGFSEEGKDDEDEDDDNEDMWGSDEEMGDEEEFGDGFQDEEEDKEMEDKEDMEEEDEEESVDDAKGHDGGKEYASNPVV